MEFNQQRYSSSPKHTTLPQDYKEIQDSHWTWALWYSSPTECLKSVHWWIAKAYIRWLWYLSHRPFDGFEPSPILVKPKRILKIMGDDVKFAMLNARLTKWRWNMKIVLACMYTKKYCFSSHYYFVGYNWNNLQQKRKNID